MWVAWRSGIPGTYVPTVHASCPHNEIAAACLRSLGPVPPSVFAPLGADVSREFNRLARLARSYGGIRWTHLQTALSYDGAMRRRYLDAERSLRECGLSTSRDSMIYAFLKAEKQRDPAKFPKPRLIYPRDPRYNLEVASRLKPFEHWLWGMLTAKRLRIGGQGRVVAKGLNPRQRANLIVRKFQNLRDCVAFEVDAKAFEAHVGPGQLKGEHQVYRAAYRGDRRLVWLLGEQLRLKGKLPCGAKFSRDGARASGDFNTGMGNTMVMLAVIVGALRSFKVPFDLLVDGDNAVIFLEGGSHQGVVGGLAAHVLQSSGHEVVLERQVSYIEGIRFGGSAPVYLGPPMGWTMVRDWERVLSCALSSHRWLREPRFAKNWMAGVARCELSLARGVPVLQAWALGGLKATGFRGAVRAHPHRDYFMMGAWLADEGSSVRVSVEARLSFQRAFGVTPECQLRYEELCSNLELKCEGRESYMYVPERSYSVWRDCPGIHESWMLDRL